MNPFHLSPTLNRIVQALLEYQVGELLLGNVLFSWNGREITWDLPPESWDIHGMWHDIIAHSELHPEIERIALKEYHTRRSRRGAGKTSFP